MLQEKERRLCSKKYLLNDREQSNNLHAKASARSIYHHPEIQDHRGHFVFPDDATDIKSHAFFNGIPWDTLHLSTAPLIPDVKNCYDTKYFDEEIPVSDVDDASSSSTVSDAELRAQEAFEEGIATAYAAEVLNMQNGGNFDGASYGPAGGTLKATVPEAMVIKGVKPREKKRARDRILRDKSVGRQVLQLRKKGAFVGYAYRRPRPVTISSETNKSSRDSVSRGYRMPSIN